MPDAAVSIIPRTFSGLEVIRLFTVLRDVQTFDFFGFGHAHTGNHIRYFQQDDGSDQSEAPSNQHAYKLVAELSPMSIHSADWFACAENRIDHLLREDAGQEGADGATRAVNSKSIQRIIIAEDRFYFCHHPIPDHASNKANRESRHWSYESSSWCNCD